MEMNFWPLFSLAALLCSVIMMGTWAIAKKINNDYEWKNNIIKKSKENKISEKEQFEKDVEYVLVSEYTPIKE